MHTTSSVTRMAQVITGDDDETLSPVERRLARISAEGNFPALSKQIIDTISALDDDASSVQRLAVVVLREYSLTLSVIRAANSVHYRRSSRPIQSATHAMLLLGAKTVRHLASSLLLFENYHKQSPGLKELMLLSLLTANHGRAIAAKIGGTDPEEAHLCGMFRNLGEVLVACHFPADYASIRAMARGEQKSESAAAYNVLGFHYEELGEAMSRRWGMPESVLVGIRSHNATVRSDAAVITAFSHDLTNVIYRRDLEGDDAHKALDDVLARYRVRLRLSREHVRDIVESALRETREVFISARVSLSSLRMRQLSDAARSALGVAPLDTGEWQVVESAAPDVLGTPQLRDKLIQELEGRIDPGVERELGSILLLALEALLRGGPFDRVVACVVNADRTRMRARSGLGTGVETLLPHFDLPLSPTGGPITAMLLQRSAVYVPTTRAMSASEQRWATSVGVTQFGLFPIIVAGKLAGCVYCDRTPQEAIPDRDAVRYGELLASTVVKAIDVRRHLASPQGTPASMPAAHITPPSVPATRTVSIPLPAADIAATWSSALQSTLADGGPMTAETKGALVLRLLQGEPAEHLAKATGLSVGVLEQWGADFLAGALAGLSHR